MECGQINTCKGRQESITQLEGGRQESIAQLEGAHCSNREVVVQVLLLIRRKKNIRRETGQIHLPLIKNVSKFYLAEDHLSG